MFHMARFRSGSSSLSSVRTAARVSVLAVLMLVAVVAAPSSSGAQAPPDTLVPLHPPSVFVPVTPTRVFSNVLNPDFFGPFEQRVPLSSYVPVGATAVAVNFTTLKPGGPFAASVYACGLWTRGYCKSEFNTFDTSAMSVNAASDLATLAIGSDRILTVGGSPGNTVVADLLGYYVPAGATPTAGRFRSVTPTRVLDTRDSGTMLDNSTVTVDLSAQVPADADAAVVTLTVVDSEREGYVTAYAANTAPPFISNLLVLPPEHTVSNQAIVGLQNRSLAVLQTGRAHLLVDLVGYYTSNAAAPGNDGLFVPVMGTEIYNSFQIEGLPDPFNWTPPTPLPAGATVEIPFTPPIFSPSIEALLLRVDAQLDSPGFVNVWGPGVHPWTTDVFVDTPGGGHTSSALAAVDGTTIRSYTSSSGWLRVQATGFFTAAATT